MTFLRNEAARQQLASWIEEREPVTARAVAEKIQRSYSTAYDLLNAMTVEGRLVKEISGHGPTIWRRARLGRPTALEEALSAWGR